MKTRTEYVAVRFSEEELQELDRQRGTLKRSVFLRNLLLRRRIPKPIPETNQRAYTETSRWASALNQLARKVNQGIDIDLVELNQTLKEFRKGLIGLKTGESDDSEDF